MKHLILIAFLLFTSGCRQTHREAETAAPVQKKGNAFEIALFGADTSSSEDSMNRSDVIRIIRIVPEKKTLRILAVQRDTMALIPGCGFRKINLAHDYGGGRLALETLNMNLDLHLTEYVSFSFTSLIRLTDLLGGIDLELSGQEAQIICGTEKEGMYLLDGRQVLALCRMRKIDNDRQRIERQNRVIRAILQKLKGCSLSQICSVYRHLSGNADFHISADCLRAAAEMIIAGDADIQTETFPFSSSAVARNLTIDGIDQIYELRDLRAEVCHAHQWLYETDSCILSGSFENLADTMYEQYPVH